MLENFQIVNGAQTSHSLIEASRHNAASIENVVLLVKIYATDRVDIVERVAVATNSQAKIQLRDLKSNHVILKKMEMAFFEKGYYFERKRNMHAEKSVARRVDALKLGQMIMTFYLRDPDRARAASDSIFDERFTQIFSETHKVDELCRLFELYSKIEKLRDRHSSRFENREKPDDDYKFLIYGHWHILYTCALIITDRKISIPLDKAADSLIVESISVVARACREPNTISHYQLFRSPKTKIKIYQEVFGPQPSLFDFMEQTN